ncbi:LptA/OstA family protein [Myxococcota bacterium]
MASVRSSIRIVSCLLAAALLSAVTPVPARGPLNAIQGDALDIAAERMELNVEEGTALLTGKVQATLGELKVQCPQVELRYDATPNIRWARASQGVRAVFKGIVAEANAVETDIVQRRITFLGGVRLSRGRGWVRAERAMIDLSTQKVTLEQANGSIPVDSSGR